MPATKSTSKSTGTSGSAASARKTPAAKPAARGGSKPQDAIALLSADHKEVKKLFTEYEKLCQDEAEAEERQALAEEICDKLSVHAQIEEEIFYPAARDAMDEADLVDEATVEHASAKDLIAQIQSGQPDDELYDARVRVLGEYINHHVKEEEGELFPEAKKAGLDLQALGEELAQRKAELMGEAGAMEEGEDADEDA